MTRSEEDEFHLARIVEGITAGITTRRRLVLYTGVSDAKFTRLAGRAIIGRKIFMLNAPDRHGGVLFGLYGQPEPVARCQGQDQSRIAQAEAFLREVLADGPVLSSEVERIALTRGLRRGVLKAARANLGVVAVKDGSISRWKVHLPQHTASSTAY